MRRLPYRMGWSGILITCALLLAGCGALASSASVRATPLVWGATSIALPTAPAQPISTVAARATAGTRATATASARPTRQPATAPRSGLPVVAAATLPPEAQDTLALLAQGGPFPFARDGVEFRNREQLLPRAPRGYYHEYTVVTPGERDRGARRIIVGSHGDIYYTPDHYASFVQVLPE